MSMSDLAAVQAVPSDNGHFVEYCRSLRPVIGDNRRVLLIQIPQIILTAFNHDVAEKRGYYIFPPTGLQCLYESARHRDLEFRILDLNFEILKRAQEDPGFDPEKWHPILQEAIEEYQPGIIGMSCLFDLGIQPMLEALRLVRAWGKAVVIGGGVICTYEWKRLLAADLCHFVVHGEGENKFNYLLDQLTGENLGVTPTPGINYHCGEDYRETGGLPDVVELKGDMVASYGLVPIEEYFRYGSLNPFSRMEHIVDSPFAAIQFARGCRAACTFCAVRDFMGKGVRARPVDDVLAEMEYLIEKRGVRHFEWLDDDLLFYRKEMQELLRRLIEKNWPITWSANNGLIAASVDHETLGLIRDSNCIGFKIGIETGNPEMLKKVRKPGTHAKFLKFASMLEPYQEVFVGGNIIVGLPEERFHQMADSVKFALAVDLDWAAVTICQAIRGASAFSEAGEYFEEQMNQEGRNVANFIPVRHSAQGHIGTDEPVARGYDIFRLDPMMVPSADQVKEIWLTFNLIINYMHNKNLRPGGRPQKFIAWVETAQRAYPTNPYMSLFLAMAYTILGNHEKAAMIYDKAIAYSADEYWQRRFQEFGLDRAMAKLPRTAEEVFACVEDLYTGAAATFVDWSEVPYGEIPTRKIA